MKKKVIAILLSLCMAVSGSSAVFAADDDGIILGEITEPEDEDSGEEFEDFSDLDKQYDNVFYGDVTDEPNNPVDAEQIALAKEIVKSMV